MSACPRCGIPQNDRFIRGRREPIPCECPAPKEGGEGADARTWLDRERRKRVVETARALMPTALRACDPTWSNEKVVASAFASAEAFETAAEKYVKGEK